MGKISFWCDVCKIDQENTYMKNWCDYPSGRREWNESRCIKCKKKILRYITQRHLDPYWGRSAKAKREVIKYEKDLIQPDDPRFKKLYPRQYERLEAVKEANEKKKLDEIKKRDDMYKRFGHNTDRRKILSKLYNF